MPWLILNSGYSFVLRGFSRKATSNPSTEYVAGLTQWTWGSIQSGYSLRMLCTILDILPNAPPPTKRLL